MRGSCRDGSLLRARNSSTLGTNMTNTIKKALFIAISVASLGIGACGGGDDGSGVDRGKQITALSASERASVCTWGIALQGGEGHKTTCGDSTITVKSAADCEASLAAVPTTCHITVGQEEDCTKAVASNACTAFTSAACAPLLACAGN
jgi:hypothetical protein